MGRLLRRACAGALASLVLAGFLVVVTESPADARKVGNPGTGFTLRVQQGFLRIKDQSFDFNDETRLPQCSDGVNNDDGQDTAIDFPADPQCTSAADDSEVAGGLQPKTPIQLTNGTVNANGTYTFPAASVLFPRQYMWVADAPVVGSFQVNIDIIAIAPATGVVDANTGLMSLSMQVEVRASGGQLNSGCKVGPITVNGMTTGTAPPFAPNPAVTGVPYNPATGRATLVHNSYSVPGASGCTATFLNVNVNGEINGQLGLPSSPGNNEAQFLGEFIGTRPQPGVTASFTTTPSSGTAPRPVAFNAGASTGTGLGYQWDFTNNGSFDASGISANFTYTTAGTHTARLRVTDSDGDFAETTRTITVGVNQPPIANDQTQSTPEDTAKAITLTGSDTEGASLVYALASPAPAHGTLTGTPPNITYTPASNYNGPDSFGFTVSDGFNPPDAGLVTLNVTAVNDAPTAANVAATIVEDTPGPVVLNGSDVDLDALTYTIVDGPTLGVFSGAGSTRTYTPNANAIGTDTFTYQASDGSLSSNIATGTITITPVNDPPVADDQVGGNAVTTNEDSAVGITLTGSDVDGTAPIFGIVTPPAHGALSGSLPNLTYTPAANYNGSDTFTFKVTDPSGATDNGTVDIVVAPVNDAPTTGDVAVGTDEDTPVDVTIPGNDIDLDALTFTPAASSVEGGTISCVGALCTYTPALGFAGADSFTVDVSDGTVTVTSTVTVNVSAFNNTQPVMNDTTYVSLEDQVRNFGLVATDADGNALTYSVLLPPASGVLTCTPAGACTFVPAANANGTLTATVQVSDGVGGIDTAVITLNVIPINDAPTVPIQTLVTAEDTPGSIELAADDVDGDVITWVVKVAPAKGSVSCTGAGVCGYTPNVDVHGADSFEVEADDGHGGRVRAVIPVTITPVDDPPTAGTVSQSVAEDGSTTFALIGADDGGSVTFTAAPASSGSLSCTTAGACTFTPTANVNGTETVAYTVSDGTSSTTGAIVLTIVAVNDAPVAVSQTLTTPEDTVLPLTLAANDPDIGDVLAFQVTSPPSIGFVGGTAPNLTYTPGVDASGTVTIGFAVTDPSGLTSNGTVTIVVTPVDDEPVADNASVTTAEDTATAIALSGSDLEGPVTTAVVTPPAHGTYAGGIYTPAANYNGPDSIGFTVTSNTAQVAHGTVSITVTPVNDAPVASDASVVTTRSVPIAITLGSTDPDGTGDHTFVVLTGPTKGTLSGTAPTLTYTPNGVITGSDTLTFKVTDGAGSVDSGTIGITINQGAPLATQVVAAPATVTKPGGLLGFLQQYTYNNLTGTLTTVGTNLPIAGVSIQFKVNGAQICSATTNASGVATCSGKGARVNVPTYQAVWPGNPSFAASTGIGTLS